MKNLLVRLAFLTMATLSSCTQGTPGGPGTSDKKPAYGQVDNTFNLSVPEFSSSLQQGEKIQATIGIKRATNFEEDVALAFDDVPNGVVIEPATPVIKHGDTDVKIEFKAEDEAVLGEFKIKVTGHPTSGGDAHVVFKLTVAAKDSFHLSPPNFSTSLKQGETQTVSIGISRDKTFDQQVGLSFGEMPTGVTLEPVAPVINHGEKAVLITVTAANDAALGNFVIKVTGHPTKGADASSELKLTVVKE